MKTYFQQDPIYKDRFSEVWLWSEWAQTRSDFDGGDTGIDLVAQSYWIAVQQARSPDLPTFARLHPKYS